MPPSTAVAPTVEAAIAALAKTPAFGAMSAKARRKLAEQGGEVRLRAGQVLVSRGDPGDALFVVLEGELEAGVATEGGRSIRLAGMGPGALIGEFSVIDGEPRAADLTATRRARVYRIPRAAVLETLEAEPKALLALASDLIARLRATNQQVEAHALLDLAARLARLLLDETGEGARLCQLTQSEMARRIFASREKVNRKLGAWRSEGLIEISRAGVRVLNAEALGAFVRRREMD